jgi:hypothetical protein
MNRQTLNKEKRGARSGKESFLDKLLNILIKPKVIVALVGSVTAIVIVLLSLIKPEVDVSTVANKIADTASSLALSHSPRTEPLPETSSQQLSQQPL